MGTSSIQTSSHDRVTAPKPIPIVPKANHENLVPPTAEETFSEAAVAVAEGVAVFVVEHVTEVVVEVISEHVAEEVAEELSNAGWKF